MSRDPAVHLLSRPGPRERVRVELVVLPPACIEVLDELLTTLPGAAFQVALAERTEQQLGLIEPRGMRGREEHAHVLVVVAQERVRRLRGVGRATVPDQVHAPRMAVL